jgi:hypothetical protein
LVRGKGERGDKLLLNLFYRKIGEDPTQRGKIYSHDA